MTAYVWLGFIAFLVGGGLTVFFVGRKAGRDATAVEIVTKVATVKQAQQKAVAESPQTQKEIVDRIREGGGI